MHVSIYVYVSLPIVYIYIYAWKPNGFPSRYHLEVLALFSYLC